MTFHHRLSNVAHASHWLVGRGHRTPRLLLQLDERDRYLREAARHFSGLSQRETARLLRSRLSVYRDGRWRRDRSELTCPVQHRGKLTAVLWSLLKTRDSLPSERLIRFVLSRSSSVAPNRRQ
jgi:hypothetical protein